MIEVRRHDRLIRTLRVVVTAIVVAGLAVLGAPGVASADPTYSITGNVTLRSTATVPAGAGAATAIASTSSTLPAQAAGSADTDASGKYTISGLMPGTYYIYIRYNGSDGYLSAWAGEPPTETSALHSVVISSSDGVSIGQTLYRPVTISGNVTLANGGWAAAGEVLVSYRTAATRTASPGAESTPVPTDASGKYTFANVPPGFYQLHFVYAGSGGYESEYLGSRSTPAEADAYAFSALLNSPIVENIQLPKLVTVSGHVSIGTAGTAATAGQVSVAVQYVDDFGTGDWTTYPSGVENTDASGNYSFSGLQTFDAFRLVFAYQGSGSYLGTTNISFYPDGSGSASRDVVIPPLYALSGHISVGALSRSAMAGEVQVIISSYDYNYSASSLTDANGNYSFSSVPGIPYSMQLTYLGTGHFANTFIRFPECDNTCSINLTGNRTGADGTVAVADQVSGHVESSSGAPVPGMKIAARQWDSATNSYVGETDALSGSDGNYSFPALNDGYYEFDVSDPHGAFATDVLYAAPYQLTLKASPPTVLPTATLQGGSVLNGTVTIPNASLADVYAGNVYAYVMTQRPSDNAWVLSGQMYPVGRSGGANTYSIPTLAEGQYKLKIVDDGGVNKAVAYSPEITVGPGSPLTVPAIALYPENPASAVADVKFTGGAGQIAAKGWAAWPASLGTSVGLAVNIGSSWYPVTANGPDAESGDGDALGTNHGFTWSLPLPAGNYTACLWASEPTGPAENIGCSSVAVQPATPTAFALDSLVGSSAGITVAGWAQYPDSPGTNVGVALNIGSGWYGFTANQPNTDAGAGNNHGFAGTVPMAPGTYTVCIWVTEQSGGARSTGCQTVVVPVPARAVVHSDLAVGGVGSLTVTGWDVFPDSLSSHVGMALNIGTAWYGFAANANNSEVPIAYPAASADHGYSLSLPVGPGTYNACIWTTEPTGPAVNAGCHILTVTAPRPADVHIDSVTGGVGTISVTGWDVFPDALSTTAGMAVQVGSSWFGLSANAVNAETSTLYPTASINHGFATTLSFSPGIYNVCVWTLEPSGPAVNAGCSIATVTAASPAVTSFDTATAVSGGIQVTGYSEFPDAPATSVGVAVQIGSNWSGFTANGAAMNPTYNGHGFTGVIPEPSGTYGVCMWTTEPAGAASLQVGCKTVVVP